MRLKTIQTILKSPLWVLQLGTGAKSFKDNRLIGSKRLNQMGLHTARVRFAHWLAWKRRARLARMVSAQDRVQFDEQGFVAIENFLPADEFALLRERILKQEAPAREMLQGDTITRRIAVDNSFLASVPALRTLIDSPRWRGLVRYVSSFDVEPLYYIQTILSGTAKARPDPQTALHADTFHPTMKAWFFLNDVADDEGPLTYVPGSHRMTLQRIAWEKAMSLRAPEGVDRLSARGSFRIENKELAALGLPPAQRFAVPANTLVVVDTNGFHARAQSAKQGKRIEIWAYSRRSPFVPWTGLDLLSIRGLAEHRVPLLWAIRDRLKRWIGQPWQDAGRKNALGD
ncbi:phytanoyl-CoA dioxygenase family protein [Rhizorhapis sp. SPR117]|uniref:phytanoyl-CoA dioxygenase family protein n=1 Tax=Rhizorhapis sp. SPR117 TaxID=2912611 RepID=UPI001F235515|nr:phytanoyl-CoA dioxygenase family protein [Rhizorhapis sp. SPR117]